MAADHQDQARQIAADLAAIAASGMILPGSITQRRTATADAMTSISTRGHRIARQPGLVSGESLSEDGYAPGMG